VKIEIDLSVYKALTNLLLHEQDTLNDVVARLLHQDISGINSESSPPSPEKAEWFGQGVSLPVGTELRSTHKKVERIGVVRKAGLEVDGELFPSLSAAAIHVVGHNINGWNFWKIRNPVTHAWQPMSTLR
jgi:hypothetical protein